VVPVSLTYFYRVLPALRQNSLLAYAGSAAPPFYPAFSVIGPC
jgi:hypothetical protein